MDRSCFFKWAEQEVSFKQSLFHGYTQVMPPYVKAEIAAQFYQLSTRRLRQLAADGAIEHKTTPGGHYRYLIDEAAQEPSSRRKGRMAPNPSLETCSTRASPPNDSAETSLDRSKPSTRFPGRRVVSRRGKRS